MSEELRDYRRDLEIDENDLPGEWLNQAGMYCYYADKWADAVFKRDEAKLKLDWVTNNLSLEIRNNLEKFGFEGKATEAAIKSKIEISKKYMEAAKELNKYNHKVNLFSNAKISFDQRKTSLSNLVSLKISGFYSEPRNQVKDIEKKISMKTHQEHVGELNKKMQERREKVKEKKQELE